jgi:hypothetical protein
LPVFDRTQIAQAVRAWDKAGTAGGDGACTAGVLMHKMRNGAASLGRCWAVTARDTVLAASKIAESRSPARTAQRSFGGRGETG